MIFDFNYLCGRFIGRNNRMDYLQNTKQKNMKKEIDAWIYDPTKSLFKKKKSEKAVGHIVYCECPEKCELYAKHKCVVFNNKCPYGSRGSAIGYSVMARKFRSWMKEFEEAHKDAYRSQLTSPKKLEYFMDCVYIPISYLNLNDNIDFYDGGGLMSMRKPIIKRSIFTANFINDNILNFIPRSYFGNAEIKDYQEKEVPKFLNWLKGLDVDLYDKVRELNPRHKGFSAMTNVGRKARLKTLNPDIGEFKDIHGGLWTWDGTYITSKNSHASFTLVETREIEECRIKPKEDVVVQITDEKQVNGNTEFID